MGTIEINLAKIEHNAKILVSLFGNRGISITGVTKVVLGNPVIIKALIQAGIKYLGDSQIINIIKMKESQIKAEFILIRVPSMKEVPQVVKFVDYSLNSEMKVIEKLSEESLKQKMIHKIILMIDMGDSREGINPSEIDYFIKKILNLKNIRLKGIGVNWKCFSGAIPTREKMKMFSDIAKRIQKQFNLKLDFVSGGNSVNYNWFMSCDNIGEINNLRIGEAIFLGKETLNYQNIPDLYTDAFNLIGEIVEIKKRANIQKDIVSSNGFGEQVPSLYHPSKNKENKFRKQGLVNFGRQDIVENGIKPKLDIKIIGASSNYLMLDLKNNKLKVGDEISFELNYEALLRAMTSPLIHKKFLTS